MSHSDSTVSFHGKTVCVTGGSGFIGRQLVNGLLRRGAVIRVLQRAAPDRPGAGGLSVHLGDLRDRETLSAFLAGGDMLINLAWPDMAEKTPRVYAAHLAQACADTGIQRVIHVSTAMVVGRPDTRTVEENTRPNPITRYEQNKLAVEEALRESLPPGVDLAILRPTAVFGPGSANLSRHAQRLLDWPSWTRCGLRFLYGKRCLHLVPVRDVVAAIETLMAQPAPLNGASFIVSADRHPANHYQAVDDLLASSLGLKTGLGGSQLPPAVLRLLLRLAGRSQDDPRLRIHGSSLAPLGYSPVVDFEESVREFGRWYAGQRRGFS